MSSIFGDWFSDWYKTIYFLSLNFILKLKRDPMENRIKSKLEKLELRHSLDDIRKIRAYIEVLKQNNLLILSDRLLR
jgi:hypothetical protein